MYRRRPSAALAEAASLAAALSSAGLLIEVLLRVWATSLTAASEAFSTFAADILEMGSVGVWLMDDVETCGVGRLDTF